MSDYGIYCRLVCFAGRLEVAVGGRDRAVAIVRAAVRDAVAVDRGPDAIAAGTVGGAKRWARDGLGL